MGPKTKATLTLIAIFLIVSLLIYSPTIVMGSIVLIMTYLMWKELHRYYKAKE